jgi:hypothetical protein
MQAFEEKPPVTIPKKDHNWSGMTITECVVDKWLLCSFTVTEALTSQTELSDDKGAP